MLQIKTYVSESDFRACLSLTCQAVLAVPGKTSDRGATPDENVKARRLHGAYQDV